MQGDSKALYPSKEQFIVKNRSLTKFAQIEFAILRYTESGEIRAADVATLVALFHYVDWGRRRGNEEHAPSSERLARLLGIEKKALWRSLKRLLDVGVIERTPSRGRPTVYDIAPVEDWAEPTVRPDPKKVLGRNSDPTPKRDRGVIPKRDRGALPKRDHHIHENRNSPESLKDLPSPTGDGTAPATLPLGDKRAAITEKANGRKGDPRVHPTIAIFAELYKASGMPYPGNFAADGAAIKRLPKEFTVEILVKLIRAYFAESDSFWSNTRSVLTFVKWLRTEAAREAFRRAASGAPIEDDDDEPTIWIEGKRYKYAKGGAA